MARILSGCWEPILKSSPPASAANPSGATCGYGAFKHGLCVEPRAVFLLAVSTLMWCGVGDAVAGGLGLSREAGAWSVCVCISVEGDRRRKLRGQQGHLSLTVITPGSQKLDTCVKQSQ